MVDKETCIKIGGTWKEGRCVVKGKPFLQKNEEIITFVFKPEWKKWKVLSTSQLWEKEWWEGLEADANKIYFDFSTEPNELLGFSPEKGKVISKVRDEAGVVLHTEWILRKMLNKDFTCFYGFKENVIVCSPKLKSITDIAEFKKKIDEKFRELLEDK